MGLPGSLEAYKSGGGLPENLWKKVKRTQDMGGIQALEDRIQDLNAAAERANQSAHQIETSLRREENLDTDFRARNPHWTGVQSASLNQDIKSNLDRLRALWTQARENDDSIARQLRDQEFRRNGEHLGKPREQLDALMPRVEGGRAGEVGAVDTSALEALLVELAQLFEKRAKLVAELRSAAQADMGNLFLASVNRGLNAGGEALRLELEKLETMKAQITDTNTRQNSLLEQIKGQNQAFVRNRATDRVTAERDAVVTRLEQTSTQFFNLHSQLSAGITFYADLQKRLTVLLQGSDDLCYTQQLQRNEFEMDVAREYERTSQEEKDREYALQLMQQTQAKMDGMSMSGEIFKHFV
jgi:programmed cell death 6-interacting protein